MNAQINNLKKIKESLLADIKSFEVSLKKTKEQLKATEKAIKILEKYQEQLYEQHDPSDIPHELPSQPIPL